MKHKHSIPNGAQPEAVISPENRKKRFRVMWKGDVTLREDGVLCFDADYLTLCLEEAPGESGSPCRKTGKETDGLLCPPDYPASAVINFPVIDGRKTVFLHRLTLQAAEAPEPSRKKQTLKQTLKQAQHLEAVLRFAASAAEHNSCDRICIRPEGLGERGNDAQLLRILRSYGFIKDPNHPFYVRMMNDAPHKDKSSPENSLRNGQGNSQANSPENNQANGQGNSQNGSALLPGGDTV